LEILAELNLTLQWGKDYSRNR